jgi:hypothetical protein
MATSSMPTWLLAATVCVCTYRLRKRHSVLLPAGEVCGRGVPYARLVPPGMELLAALLIHSITPSTDDSPAASCMRHIWLVCRLFARRFRCAALARRCHHLLCEASLRVCHRCCWRALSTLRHCRGSSCGHRKHPSEGRMERGSRFDFELPYCTHIPACRLCTVMSLLQMLEILHHWRSLFFL